MEVYQFARDAAVAEAWLNAQVPYLKSRNFGRNLEEVITLIKKHEAFEKSALAQDERFLALEKLTNFELKEMQRREYGRPGTAASSAGRQDQHDGAGTSAGLITTFPAHATELGSMHVSHEGLLLLFLNFFK